MSINGRNAPAAVLLFASLLAACSSSSNQATTVVSQATETAAIAETTPNVDSIPATGGTTRQVVTTTLPATSLPPLAAWTSQPVGTIASSVADLNQIAFAPDGRAVAFSEVDTSCCSNEVRGWARSVEGAWSEIETAQAVFVSGDTEGTLGGPTAVVWFKDRFIAVGQRGVRVEPAEPGESVTWSSLDGVTWIVSPVNDDALGTYLFPSLDGTSLLGLWNTEAAPQVRSTTDGVTWKQVSSLETVVPGGARSARILTSIAAFAGQPAQYVIGGGTASEKGYLAMSTDAINWKSVILEPPAGQLNGYPSDAFIFNNTLIAYGTTFVEGDDGETNELAVAWQSKDGVTFTSQLINAGCAGSLRDMTIDPQAATPTLLAICAAVVGPIEGDFANFETRLVASTDGGTFSAVPNLPEQWATPAIDLGVGPLAVTSGRLTIGVATNGPTENRVITVWSR